MVDIAIIGAGIAGLTSAIYCARAGVNFVLLEQDGYGGGQLTSAHLVENYPGVPSISGADLTEQLRSQAISFGTNIKLGIVKNIIHENKINKVILNSGEVIECKAAICATGARPRKLGVDGEERLLGKGVSYCALCDGPFFKDKNAFVFGGGDSAIEDALYLSEICNTVTLVHRRNEFTATKSRLLKLNEKNNIEIRTGENLLAIMGDTKVDGVYLQSDTEKLYFQTDCVFIAVGLTPATEYLRECNVELNNGYVVAKENCETTVPGVFVAGDIRKKYIRQAVTAAADGANAAYSAIEYLKR